MLASKTSVRLHLLQQQGRMPSRGALALGCCTELFTMQVRRGSDVLMGIRKQPCCCRSQLPRAAIIA